MGKTGNNLQISWKSLMGKTGNNLQISWKSLKGESEREKARKDIGSVLFTAFCIQWKIDYE